MSNTALRNATPLSETVRLYLECKNLAEVARLTGMTKAAVKKRLQKFHIPIHNPTPPLDRDPVRLKEMYDSGMSARAIGDVLGCSERTVFRWLKQLEISDPSRRLVKRHENPTLRAYARKPYEFKASTKATRFTAEHGVCQWCNQPVGDKWNDPQATYHHIVPIDSGGDGSFENCMLLHRKCHEDPEIFRILHGGRRWNFRLAPRSREPREVQHPYKLCPDCGAKSYFLDKPCRICRQNALIASARVYLEDGTLTYTEIAERVGVSDRTIGSYARKLGLHQASMARTRQGYKLR